MSIKSMQNNVIRNFGFEHPATIYFFQCCKLPDSNEILIKTSYEIAMSWPTEE